MTKQHKLQWIKLQIFLGDLRFWTADFFNRFKNHIPKCSEPPVRLLCQEIQNKRSLWRGLLLKMKKMAESVYWKLSTYIF